jgi:hypothetical protein
VRLVGYLKEIPTCVSGQVISPFLRVEESKRKPVAAIWSYVGKSVVSEKSH